MPSFDVVSELDKHEVTNAVENAVKELDRRYDLKGKGSFEFKEKDLTVNLTAEADFQLEAMIEILKLALVKRKIDVQCLEVKDAYASGKLMKQEAVLKEGIDKELAKKIVAHIKDAKLKVQAAIQGEQVRVTGKSVTTCRKPLRHCGARNSACRCNSTTSATDTSVVWKYCDGGLCRSCRRLRSLIFDLLIVRLRLKCLGKDRSLVALDSSYTAPTRLLRGFYGASTGLYRASIWGFYAAPRFLRQRCRVQQK